MSNQNGESGYVVKEQLCELYAEIESTKNIELELLRAIWTDRLCGIQLKESDHSLFEWDAAMRGLDPSGSV
jgi:hypothetical protein